MSNKIEAEYYAYVINEIARLTAVKATLDRGTSPVVVSEAAKAPKKQSKVKVSRPPRGAVEEALLGSLSDSGQTNAEIRTKLKGQGYKYSLHPLQMAKALNRLAAKGKARKVANGNRVEFSKLPSS